jgi:2-polyprenyl-6-methoxyphenol hydroxylase-like FAD-dependent oxidoreductase
MNSIETRHANGKLIYRSDTVNYYSSYWREVLKALIDVFPKDKMKFQHNCTNIKKNQDSTIVVTIVPKEKEEFEDVCDYLIGADGSSSMVREFVRGKEKMAYAGYFSWRGVFDVNDSSTYDLSESDMEEFLKKLKTVYPDLGTTLYYTLTDELCHFTIYMTSRETLYWEWCINRERSTNTAATFYLTDEETEYYLKSGLQIFGENLHKLMKITKKTLCNWIEDKDPIDKFVYDNIILVGDAAHPVQPHRGAASSMAFKDAYVLSELLKEGNFEGGLQKFNHLRVNETANIVIHSRYLGDLRQGLNPKVKWSSADEKDIKLLSKKTPYDLYFK